MTNLDSKDHPVVQEVNQLFRQLRHLPQERGRYSEARKMLTQLQTLVQTLVASGGNDYVEALQTEGYASLEIGRRAPTKPLKARYQEAGYEALCKAVDVRLSVGKDFRLALSAYNVGVDLNSVMHQPERARYYLLLSRSILKLAEANPTLPTIRFMISTNLAKCEVALGNNKKAARILRASIARYRPRFDHWNDLRAYASALELLGQILLEEVMMK